MSQMNRIVSLVIVALIAASNSVAAQEIAEPREVNSYQLDTTAENTAAAVKALEERVQALEEAAQAALQPPARQEETRQEDSATSSMNQPQQQNDGWWMMWFWLLVALALIVVAIVFWGRLLGQNDKPELEPEPEIKEPAGEHPVQPERTAAGEDEEGPRPGGGTAAMIALIIGSSLLFGANSVFADSIRSVEPNIVVMETGSIELTISGEFSEAAASIEINPGINGQIIGSESGTITVRVEANHKTRPGNTRFALVMASGARLDSGSVFLRILDLGDASLVGLMNQRLAALERKLNGEVAGMHTAIQTRFNELESQVQNTTTAIATVRTQVEALPNQIETAAANLRAELASKLQNVEVRTNQAQVSANQAQEDANMALVAVAELAGGNVPRRSILGLFGGQRKLDEELAARIAERLRARLTQPAQSRGPYTIGDQPTSVPPMPPQPFLETIPPMPNR